MNTARTVEKRATLNKLNRFVLQQTHQRRRDDFLQRLARRVHRYATALMMMFAITLVACGGGVDIPGPNDTSKVQATIGVNGGTVNGPDGVQVVIPAGALSQPTTIGIARSAAGAPTTFPADITPTGSIYEFTPHDVTFNTPVTIRMPVSANADGTEALMASPGGDWQVQEVTVNGQFAEWQRNGFSWGLYGYACAPTNRAPYSNNNPDPYPCWFGPSGGTDAAATPVSAITRTAHAWPNSYYGTAGSWTVNQASTVHLTVRYAAAPDCENARVKLIRWNPAVPPNTPGRVQTLFDQPVTITPTTFPIPGGIGTYVRAVGSTTRDVTFSHLDNGTAAFGYSFSCNRPFRTARTGGDISTFVVSVPVPSVTYTIGGAVNGLTGTGLVLQNNSGDNLAIPSNGTFTFATPVGAGSNYNVSVLTQPTGQICTVTNGSGTANANVANVTVNCTANTVTYTIGGLNITTQATPGLVLQNNGADDLLSEFDGTFTFATRVGAGSTYNVTVRTAPAGQTCTVTNGSGTANANVTNVEVFCQFIPGPLALVANSGITNGINGLSVYRVNPTTGVLSLLNNVSAGNTPWTVAVSPNGLYAYVGNMMGDSVSVYGVNAVTGTLTPLTGWVSNNPAGIAVDRLGRYIWVANYGWHTVQAFATGSNGTLTPIGAPLKTLSALPHDIVAHPTLDFVYVTHDSGFAITAYSVNTDGSLTWQQTLSNAITSPNGLVIDPSGRFAYSVSGSGGISAFGINPATGRLSSIGSVSTNGGAFSVAVHPNGQYLYVTLNSTTNNVLVFAINQTTGAVTLIGSPYSAGSNPRGVAVSPSGNYLYVTNYVGNTVSSFSIGGGGLTLTSLGAAIPTGTNPTGIAVIP